VVARSARLNSTGQVHRTRQTFQRAVAATSVTVPTSGCSCLPASGHTAPIRPPSESAWIAVGQA
jgi:hypothetical protein